MALKIYDKFSPRANVGDTNYPNGSIKNESVPGAKDGTPLDADWGNDYAGFDAALFAEVGIVPNGDADTALASQRLKALQLLHINDTSKVFEFETIQDMKDSAIVFPVGKHLHVADIDATYTVTSGSTPRPISSPDLNGFGYALLDVGVILHAKKWGVTMDGVTDDTASATELIEYLKTTSYTVLDFGSGTLLHSGLPNFVAPTTVGGPSTLANITYKGAGSGACMLKYTGTGKALVCNAFDPALSGTKQFINNLRLEGFSVVGDNATVLWELEGVARSIYKDLKFNGTAATGGTATGLGWSYGASGTVGMSFKSIQLSSFYDVYCSYVDGDVPYRGTFFVQGNNGSTSAGACSNNRFYGLYDEGNYIGMQMASNGGSQNVFTGGSQEACFNWGVILGPDCQYNTFIGVGWENINAAGGDLQSDARFTRYINCYSSNKMLMSGDGEKIEGGIFERFEINSSAISTTVEDIRVNNWASGSGGFINSGSSTRFRNIYDVDLGDYVYPVKSKISLASPTGSPHSYTNVLQKKVVVQVQGGTVTKVSIKSRGGLDAREVPKPTDGFSGTFGDYELDAGDTIVVSYSVKPELDLTERQY